MAIAITEPVAAYVTNSDASVYTSTNTWTPAVDDILVGFITATGSTLASPTLTTALGPTWTLRASATFNSGANTLYCYTAVVSSAVLLTPVFDCTGDSATGCMMGFLTFTGGNTSSPVVQFKTKDSTTGSNPSITFDSNLTTTSGYAIGYGINANPANLTSAPSSWSIADDTGHTTPTAGLAVCYRAGGETGATITATRGSINHGIIGIEIAVAAGAATYTVGKLPMMGVG